MGAVRSVAASAVVTGLVLAAAGPALAATATQVPVQSTGFFGGLFSVDAVSSADGWAVGGNGNGVVQRFNGTRWSLVPSPDLLAGGANGWADLTGVDATSPGNAFAVGNSTAASGGAKAAVALRWNGSAWSRQSVPGAAGTDTEFAAVKAFSASDAWAVGQSASTNSTFRKTLTMHYNGTAWSPAPAPSPGTRTNFLTAVDGVASGNVWAVGYSLNLPYGNRVRQSTVLHWDGADWTQVASPSNGSTFLYDVAAVSASDAWAVGSSAGGAFVIRWNGTAWNPVAGPPLAGLRGVTARSATDVWVAGFDAASLPAVAHWNGTTWSVTPLPVTGGVGTPLLTAVTAADADTEWVVGAQSDGTTGQSSGIAFRVDG
ncbi:hypothetical protein GCM10020358_31640 [Amorphoplanes nipponensis]|uniref:Uncharacterized protein n=1 Tax=Actinoplanes nipponensis TaxID=135950 RepID=A0A919JWY6_9ACTN|nr:hypothetical protein [Actinoplanes nipponensis]GIE54534.1 hypothetical protein Ani05nite_80680 [Actinoplanes nipponensis]